MATLNLTNARGGLAVSSRNARYLVDAYGKPVYLAGFHTWYDVQDGGGSDPPSAFDWDAYVAALKSYGCNWTKLWAMETGRGWSDATDQWFTPPRYKRTGPGNDNDGKLKFDLTQVNPDFIDRLRSRCSSLEENGIYFVIQLFQGWQIENNKGGTGSPCNYHPYLSANNINSVDGDNNDDGHLTETHFPAAQGNNALTYQEDLVDAIIDATWHFDHLIGWEISNEDTDDATGYNTDWQEYMIGYINTYQASLPKQHLVGMTKQYPDGEDATLDASGADWVSYATGKADAVHAATDPVSFYDTDHTVGLTSAYSWAWEAFCNGHGGSWYMDEWDGALYGTDRRNNATYQLIRSQLGYILDITDLIGVNLLDMTPQAALCSTGFCLARDHASAGKYVCYNVNGSATFTLDLTNATGTLNIRWLKCSDGSTTTDTVSGGANRTLTNPTGYGVSVAYVYH